MSAQIGPRLGSLLSDLGIAHTANPEPRRREHWPTTVAVPTARTLYEVSLEVDDVDIDALVGAGLIRPAVFLTGVNGTVRPEDVPALAEMPGVRSVELTTTKRRAIHSSVPATKADFFRTSTPPRSGAGVVVGVVDTGIDIFHHAFRTDAGDTRIAALWDMTSPHTLSALGAPTGGTFEISWTPPGSTTAETTAPPLDHDATAADVQARLEGLASIDPGDVVVTGGPLPSTPIVVSFAGQYRRQDVEPLEVASAITPSGNDIIVESGRKYDFAAINAAVRQPEGQWGSWDEDGHGTHVAGIAAGDGSQSGTDEEGGMCHGSGYYIGVAPGADLVIVKTTFSAAANKKAVQWIFTEAGARPAVVNLSYGSEDSAHDGSEEEEREYDALLALNPVARSIVAAAGNSGAGADVMDPDARNDGGLHASKSISANDTATIRFVVASGDTADDWLYLWYGGAARLSLTVETPPGATSGSVNPGDPAYTTPLDGHDLYIENLTNHSPTGRHNISVRISPRAIAKPTIVSGTWTLHLTETAGTDADADCWIAIEGDDPNPQFVNGDQDRTRTIDSPGAGMSVVTVAEYDHRNNTLSETSGRGPTVDVRPAGETKPDIAAPGTGIIAAKSRARNTGRCSDCCYDFYVGLSGTSMATPHVTGVVALMFEADPTLTWSDVRTRLRDGADPPDPITAPILPNGEWGAGILNAKKALQVPDVTNSARSQVAVVRPSPLDELRAAVLSTPLGQVAAALVSTHFDEVLRLVNARRRVTVAWHRIPGPALLDHLVHSEPGSPVVVPTSLHGRDVGEGLARLLTALEAEGSLALRRDVERHRALLLSLPGHDLARLEPLDLAR
jgi:subtilisin family serine protease